MNDAKMSGMHTLTLIWGSKSILAKMSVIRLSWNDVSGTAESLRYTSRSRRASFLSIHWVLERLCIMSVISCRNEVKVKLDIIAAFILMIIKVKINNNF